jgi:thiol-disulfide isomerase/thioredoxin
MSTIAAAGGILSQITMMHAILALVVGAVSVVGAYYFYTYVSKKFSVKYKENKEHESAAETSGGKDAELILFTVDWCPHCKQAKPEWEQVKTEYNGTVVNGYTILFTEVNCTNETPDIEKMVNQYKIEGYPTIKMIKDGQVIEFDAKPTKSTLTQFITTVVS